MRINGCINITLQSLDAFLFSEASEARAYASLQQALEQIPTRCQRNPQSWIDDVTHAQEKEVIYYESKFWGLEGIDCYGCVIVNLTFTRGKTDILSNLSNELLLLLLTRLLKFLLIP